MALLDTVNQIEVSHNDRIRKRMQNERRAAERRDYRRMRMGRPEATSRGQQLPSVNPPAQQGQFTSFHNSRYAGNASDQGTGFPMPPPVGTGYDMREVLARMHEIYLTNRQMVNQQRERERRVYEALMQPTEPQSQPNPPVNATPDNPAPGSSGGGGQPVGTGPSQNPVQPTIGTSGTYGGGSSGNGWPVTGLPTTGDVLGDIRRRGTPQPILWGQY